jgi:RNA polymerase sigma factor (sigma-70 family)
MAKERFEILGHDNPLGYPAPVVPVGRLDGLLVAFYASDRVTEVVIEDESSEFVKYDEALRRALRDFDYHNERLFGFSDDRVDSYKIDEQSAYFRSLLRDIHFSLDNPFLRLSLAKATGEKHLTIFEIFLCSLRLARDSTEFTDAWYRAQYDMLEHGYDLIGVVDLPQDWRELRYFLTPEQSRLVQISLEVGGDPEPEWPAPETARDHPSRALLSELSDADLVAYFNNADPKSTDGARAFEEVVSRYMPLIRDAVRRYEKLLPPWEPLEDVTSNVIFTVYKNMHLLDRAKNVRGYIATVAKNAAIDAVRRARREGTRVSFEGSLDEIDGLDRIIGPQQVPQIKYDERTNERSALLNRLVEEIIRARSGSWAGDDEKAHERSTLLKQVVLDICEDELDEILVNNYFIRGIPVRDILPRLEVGFHPGAPSRATVYRRIRGLRERMLSWFKKRGISSSDDLI